MHLVDEPGGEEVVYDGGAAADPDVLVSGCFAGGLERLGRSGVEEVERAPRLGTSHTCGAPWCRREQPPGSIGAAPNATTSAAMCPAALQATSFALRASSSPIPGRNRPVFAAYLK